MRLRLEVADFKDDTRWRWRLTTDSDAFVADHVVNLSRDAAECQGFVDAYDWVRWNADPDRGIDGERRLVAQLGTWIGTEVWGPVGVAIADQAARGAVVVDVRLPAEAEVLLYRPFELGFVNGRPLAEHDVSLVFSLDEIDSEADKAPIRDRLRMLALFSVPTNEAALNVRSERHEMRQLVKRIVRTAGRAVELRILQYGVTRDRLSEVLAEHPGWDVIHFSGHGLPAGLVLEQADGTADLIRSDEFVSLLRPARERLKLVVLSSCESAAATMAQTVKLLGLSLPDAAEESREVEGSLLPAVATELVDRIGCAVLAMRYPVGDSFATALAQHLYEGLLRDRQPLTRALQVAIQKAGRDKLVAPLSVATPALFGPAAELFLEPPAGVSEGFDVSTPGLAYFEPEADRFVGRVGQLARASAALSPTSPYRAVLFHGMAGAGKTACALELAYRHEGHRFEAMAWYRAPVEGDNIRSALGDFAVALESQLQGLELAYAVDDRRQLELLLPRVTHLLRERAILIVVDNVESLLTPSGEWKDERWRLLVEAFIAHNGLSRLVLTSRHLPTACAADPRVLVERIDALSAMESLLLARELPNLGTLLRSGDADGRELLRLVLEVVQGNPKLIELADGQAANPTALRERLTEAADAWSTARGSLAVFFTTGQHDRDFGAHDFLRVLEAWTTGAVARLPDDARLMFYVLCVLEDADRAAFVVEGAWDGVWRRLGREGDPPDATATMAAVIEQGLVATQQNANDQQLVYYRLHPAVESAGRRTAEPELQQRVDEQLAVFWANAVRVSIRHETSDQASFAVVHAGLAAAPYLLRLGRLEEAGFVLDRAMGRDRSSHTLAVALPYLEEIAERAVGTPGEHRAQAALLRARAVTAPAATIPSLRDLVDRMEAANDLRLASSVAAVLVQQLQRTGQIEEALRVAEWQIELSRRADFGPWTQLSDEGKRLQILQAMGRNATVLPEILAMRGRMDQLTLEDTDEEIATPWNVRETLLEVGARAAGELRQYQVALDLFEESSASKRERGAAPLELTLGDLNKYGALIGLRRYEEAETLLRRARAVLDAEKSREGLSILYDAWASLESARRHHQEAVGFGRRALRLDYALGHPAAISTCHHNLANYLGSADADSTLILAHRIASVLIARRISSGRYDVRLSTLAHDLNGAKESSAALSFDEVCRQLREQENVDFAELCTRLPATEESNDEALQAILTQIEDYPSEVVNADNAVERFDSIIALIVGIARGDARLRDGYRSLREELANSSDWQGLAQVVDRIVAGERDATALLQALDSVDAAIVEEVLRRLSEAEPEPPVSDTATAR